MLKEQGQNLHNERGRPGIFTENYFPELGGAKQLHLLVSGYFYDAGRLIAYSDMRVGIAADRYTGGYSAASDGIDTDR